MDSENVTAKAKSLSLSSINGVLARYSGWTHGIQNYHYAQSARHGLWPSHCIRSFPRARDASKGPSLPNQLVSIILISHANKGSMIYRLCCKTRTYPGRALIQRLSFSSLL